MAILPIVITVLESNLLFAYVILSPIDQNPCAHWRNPIHMIRQGWSMSLFHVSQQ